MRVRMSWMAVLSSMLLVGCAAAYAPPAATAPQPASASLSEKTASESLSPLQASPPAPMADSATPSVAVAGPKLYPPERIDQLMAPIALYPDKLVALILMASTYPAEVAEASKWVQTGDYAISKADTNKLRTVMEAMDWDPSVKSLTVFPKTLITLSALPAWLQSVGDVVLIQLPDALDSIQRLRARAMQAGSLKATPMETFQPKGGRILANSGLVIFVPFYDTATIYGLWPYKDFPPVAFASPIQGTPAQQIISGALDGAVSSSFTNWALIDWSTDMITVDLDKFDTPTNLLAQFAAAVGAPAVSAQSRQGILWQHDPVHRRDVAYHDVAVSAKFQAAATTANIQRASRGPEDRDHKPGSAAAPRQAAHQPNEPGNSRQPERRRDGEDRRQPGPIGSAAAGNLARERPAQGGSRNESPAGVPSAEQQDRSSRESERGRSAGGATSAAGSPSRPAVVVPASAATGAEGNIRRQPQRSEPQSPQQQPKAQGVEEVRQPRQVEVAPRPEPARAPAVPVQARSEAPRPEPAKAPTPASPAKSDDKKPKDPNDKSK